MVQLRTCDRYALDGAISRARAKLLADQKPDGHWCYELEADCTIPAEYILMMHFMDEVDVELQRKMANFLRRRQLEEGGWPLYTGGDANISCSVKAYYALKLAGDDPSAIHMQIARQSILNYGGAAKANVFTRIALAQFGQVPWRAVPFMPVEIMLLPKWFFFHLDKVAYWSRTVIVPLIVLCSLRVLARNATGIGCEELFVTPPDAERDYFSAPSGRARRYMLLDAVGRRLEPFIPKRLRRRALTKAESWFVERLNGEDGLGAIFPAMVNAYEALAALGYGMDDPLRRTARRALRKLLVEQGDEAYCQPCVSPVWDTGLAVHALVESARQDDESEAVEDALDWLVERQIHRGGDWQVERAGVTPGGWAFQYRNDHYPDIDDTALVAWAMCKQNPEKYQETIRKAADWVAELQSANGGFAAFDVDNTHYHLNDIPFADHGAMLDPPTADVSARVVALLANMGGEQHGDTVSRCLAYLSAEQETDGAWFGRWGTNYIYGTWSVLVALTESGISSHDPRVRRAVSWLGKVQGEDGGWGETNDGYESAEPELQNYRGNQGSTSYQTAWAVLALLAAGEAGSDAVHRGVEYLLATQREDGLWRDTSFTSPGFPRVFYLKYHGYSKYFPLWALACFRNANTLQDA